MKKTLAASALCFAFTGCFHYKYTNTAKPGKVAPDVWHYGFIAGIIESNPVDLSKVCPGGNFAQVDSNMTVVDGLITYVTERIFVPNHVTVTCAEGSDPLSATSTAPVP